MEGSGEVSTGGDQKPDVKGEQITIKIRDSVRSSARSPLLLPQSPSLGWLRLLRPQAQRTSPAPLDTSPQSSRAPASEGWQLRVGPNLSYGSSVHLRCKVICLVRCAQMGAAQDGQDVSFKVRTTTKFDKVFDAYCERKAVSKQHTRFLYDGARVQGAQTVPHPHIASLPLFYHAQLL